MKEAIRGAIGSIVALVLLTPLVLWGQSALYPTVLYPDNRHAGGDVYLNGSTLCLDAACDESIYSDGFKIIMTVGGIDSLYQTSSATQALMGLNAGTGELINIGSVFDFASKTIAADDTTPAVGNGAIFYTSDNTVPTAITDLDVPYGEGQMLWICIGGTGANASTIADGGNFNLSAAWNPGLDDCIQLLVQADNDYIELSRSDN